MDKAKKIEVQILNAFVDNGKGGNPAGIVLDADTLSNSQKLSIAAAVGLSETAFISKSKSADFKLDFFTPTKQIAHCGHATIATFSYLHQLGKIPNKDTSKETIDGVRQIKMIGELAFMEQQAPTYKDIAPKRKEILNSLGLGEADLLQDAPISIVNTGNSFLIIPVANAQILQAIKANFEQITAISEALDLIGYYVFTTDTKADNRDVSTRMFAPRYGIAEESGTGTAAGPLACYLFDKLQIKKQQFLIQQGKYMQTPSVSLLIVDLSIEKQEIVRLMVGGKGIFTSKKLIEVI